MRKTSVFSGLAVLAVCASIACMPATAATPEPIEQFQTPQDQFNADAVFASHESDGVEFVRNGGGDMPIVSDFKFVAPVMGSTVENDSVFIGNAGDFLAYQLPAYTSPDAKRLRLVDKA